MDKILALLDGSEYSESVCHHTAWIAQKLNAGIVAMHVLGRREGAAPTDLSGSLRLGARSALLAELSSLDEKRAKLAQAKGHAILEDAKAILEQDGVPQVQTRLRKGDLLEAVQDMEPDIRAITIGKDLASACALHVTLDYAARLRAAGAQFYDAPAPEGREGARLVTFDGAESFLAALGPDLASGRDLILVCRSGRRTAAAADALAGVIPNRIISVDGGMIAVVQGGYSPVPAP